MRCIQQHASFTFKGILHAQEMGGQDFRSCNLFSKYRRTIYRILVHLRRICILEIQTAVLVQIRKSGTTPTPTESPLKETTAVQVPILTATCTWLEHDY